MKWIIPLTLLIALVYYLGKGIEVGDLFDQIWS